MRPAALAILCVVLLVGGCLGAGSAGPHDDASKDPRKSRRGSGSTTFNVRGPDGGGESEYNFTTLTELELDLPLHAAAPPNTKTVDVPTGNHTAIRITTTFAAGPLGYYNSMGLFIVGGAPHMQMSWSDGRPSARHDMNLICCFYPGTDFETDVSVDLIPGRPEKATLKAGGWGDMRLKVKLELGVPLPANATQPA